MRNIMAFAFAALAVGVSAQPIQLEMNSNSGLFKKGEQVTMILRCSNCDSQIISCTIRKNLGEKQNIRLSLNGDSATVVNERYNGPAAYIVEASQGSETVSLGYVIDAGSIAPGTPRPEDFDSFWYHQKQLLKKKPFEVEKKAVANIPHGYECYDISISCPETKSARGFIAYPNKAKNGTLPIVIYFHAAGVDGDWCKSKPENALEYAKKGAICLDLNAHGMLNNQPDSYYSNLANDELNEYYISAIDSKENIYYKGMYLRLLQSINYLTTLPEWDGKRILVLGESQGGGQALIAAGLDHRVSAVAAVVPAMCDWGGYFTYNQGGWPDLFNTKSDRAQLMETLPYFDAAHALKGSKADIWVEIGLIDTTCPPTSILAAINQSEGKKNILSVPYRNHHLDQHSYQNIWESTINRSRLDFIDNYLK